VIPFPKIVGSVSSGFVLCLSLNSITQAAADPCLDKQGSQSSVAKCGEEKRNGIETIKGEVLVIEGDNYMVQKFYGKAVWLVSDAASQVKGRIVLGDSIEAKVREVDNQKRVLSIHQIK
jgi:hypothetical protein